VVKRALALLEQAHRLPTFEMLVDIDTGIPKCNAVGRFQRPTTGVITLGKAPTFTRNLLVEHAVVF